MTLTHNLGDKLKQATGMEPRNRRSPRSGIDYAYESTPHLQTSAEVGDKSIEEAHIASKNNNDNQYILEETHIMETTNNGHVGTVSKNDSASASNPTSFDAQALSISAQGVQALQHIAQHGITFQQRSVDKPALIGFLVGGTAGAAGGVALMAYGTAQHTNDDLINAGTSGFLVGGILGGVLGRFIGSRANKAAK